MLRSTTLGSKEVVDWKMSSVSAKTFTVASHTQSGRAVRRIEISTEVVKSAKLYAGDAIAISSAEKGAFVSACCSLGGRAADRPAPSDFPLTTLAVTGFRSGDCVAVNQCVTRQYVNISTVDVPCRHIHTAAITSYSRLHIAAPDRSSDPWIQSTIVSASERRAGSAYRRTEDRPSRTHDSYARSPPRTISIPHRSSIEGALRRTSSECGPSQEA